MKRLVGVLVLAGVFALACSSGAGSIGASCSGTCGDNDFCNQLGVCTRSCTTHADCGCAPGTTNADIANGKCSVACTNAGTTTVCAATCANNATCNGQTTCSPAVDASGTPFGYSLCV